MYVCFFLNNEARQWKLLEKVVARKGLSIILWFGEPKSILTDLIWHSKVIPSFSPAIPKIIRCVGILQGGRKFCFGHTCFTKFLEENVFSFCAHIASKNKKETKFPWQSLRTILPEFFFDCKDTRKFNCEVYLDLIFVFSFNFIDNTDRHSVLFWHWDKTK